MDKTILSCPRSYEMIRILIFFTLWKLNGTFIVLYALSLLVWASDRVQNCSPYVDMFTYWNLSHNETIPRLLTLQSPRPRPTIFSFSLLQNEFSPLRLSLVSAIFVLCHEYYSCYVMNIMRVMSWILFVSCHEYYSCHAMNIIHDCVGSLPTVIPRSWALTVWINEFFKLYPKIV